MQTERKNCLVLYNLFFLTVCNVYIPIVPLSLQFCVLFSERALDFNIILDDVSITELAFSPQYSAAVEAKQVAAQEAQRASFLVERAKQQRQEKIVQAEGEAQSAKMVGQQTNT